MFLRHIAAAAPLTTLLQYELKVGLECRGPKVPGATHDTVNPKP